MEDQALCSELEAAAQALYKGLNDGADCPGETEVVAAMLESSACVWIGSGFVAANLVSKLCPPSFYPCLYSIPSILQPFPAVLGLLGVSPPSLLSLDTKRSMKPFCNTAKAMWYNAPFQA